MQEVKMKNKRLISILLAGAMLTGSLTGCGSAPEKSTEAAKATTAGQGGAATEAAKATEAPKATEAAPPGGIPAYRLYL